jgi:hypothetical protein
MMPLYGSSNLLRRNIERLLVAASCYFLGTSAAACRRFDVEIHAMHGFVSSSLPKRKHTMKCVTVSSVSLIPVLKALGRVK